MPTFAPSYSLLGYIYLSTGENLDEGAKALKTAIQLEPQNNHLRLNLASLQMRMRDFDGAKKILEPLVNTDVGSSAQAMLNSIESYKQALASPRGGVVVVEDAGNEMEPATGQQPPRLKRRDQREEEPVRTNSPTGAPVSLEGAQQMSGVITAVECKGNSMVISLKSADKITKFQVTDHNQVPFFSRAVAYSVDIVCGPNNIQAIIYFKPISGKPALAGEVVAVEFKK